MPQNCTAGKLALMLLFVVFVGESLIMLGLSRIEFPNVLVEAAVDAVILVALLAPALYFLMFAPLVRKNEELSEARDELEDRVTERTRELAAANRALESSVSALKQRRDEFARLGDMGKMFQAAVDMEEAASAAGHQLSKLFPGTSGALYVMKESRNQLDRAITWNGEAAFPRVFAPEECWAVRCGRPHYHHAEDAAAMRCAHVTSPGAGDQLCVPMTAHGETIGVLCLDDVAFDGYRADARVFMDVPAERLDLFTTVGETLALGIANLRLRETLRRQALRDPLTGLFNRRYLSEVLAREVGRAGSLRTRLGVAMIDVDHFKRFNDQYGHSAGDTVLAALGNLLTEGAGPTDVVARHGGEEFVLVMPDADAEAATARLEALRLAVSSMAVHHNGEPLGRITISAGLAMFPPDADDAPHLLRAADEALYAAKHAGRNRVERYRPELAGSVDARRRDASAAA